MKTEIELAKQAGWEYADDDRGFEPLWRFAELVRADERWLSSQRRGVLMFSPYTGMPRHPSDIASDPHGILMLDPDQPIRAARSNT